MGRHDDRYDNDRDDDKETDVPRSRSRAHAQEPTPGRKTSRGIVRRSGQVLAATLALGGLAAGAALPAAASTRPAAVASKASGTVVIALTKTKYGTILTENGFALYRFTGDKKKVSACTGSCATTFPPVVLPKGQTKPESKGVSKLGVITRAGGTHQVTYEGIPLYRFSGDAKAGQTNGEGVQKKWYVINPATPTAIPKAATTSSTSAAGGIAY